jgi:hypothetical protein
MYQIVKIKTGEIISKTPSQNTLSDSELLAKYPEMRYLFQINRKQFLKSL